MSVARLVQKRMPTALERFALIVSRPRILQHLTPFS
jgi:hypothetical protein